MSIQTAADFRTSLKSSASFGWLKTGVIGFCASQLMQISPALSNPVGATVTTGSASIAISSNQTQINQKSEDVVIDWSSFNIGAGQTTRYVQPNAQAIAVNRIGGNSASQILGTLDANGRIVLINGNGMLFGKGSQVNVGSLVATSTDSSDSDALSGNFTQAGNQIASVVNHGRITASQGGLVALVAPSVTNAGTVNAKFGTVAVGAANKFTVDFSGDGLVSFAAQGDVNGKASAINTGSLVGANVSLTTHAAEGLATGVVTMSGIVTAQTARNVGGTILLDAGDGSLSMTGTLNAAGQTGGGNIETSGNQVAISGTVTAGKNGNWKVDPENLTIDSSAATTIDNALNSGTSVTEQTTSGAASGYGNQSPGAGDIIVASALSWNTAATLTLNSYHSIYVDAPITVQGGGGLVFDTNNGGTGGDYFFQNGASITYPGPTNSGARFTLNGTPYTLLYSMGDAQNINNNLSGNYALANPLNASSVTGWIPIGTDGNGNVLNSGNGFTGTFAGLGNTISNLTVSLPNTSYVGLFGYAGPDSTIRNFGLVNASVTGEGAVGGLVAFESGGAITNSYVTGLVGTGNTDENTTIGGLVGYNDGTVTDSYSTASIDAIINVNLKFTLLVGGLVGENAGSISASYVDGVVQGAVNSNIGSGDIGGLVGLNSGSISNAYSAGLVSARALDNKGIGGGFVGESTGAITGSYSIAVVLNSGVPNDDGFGSGTATDSYWDTQTSGVTLSGGGTGVTTGQLMGSLPAGFSSSAWGTGTDLLPYLLWQYPNGAPQAISGYAYKNDGTTPLVPTVEYPTSVSALVNGASEGPAGTYADGFYYFLLAPGTIPTSGAGVLVYTTQNSNTGATNGALLEAATGSLDFLNIWGGQFIAPTSDTTYTLASQTSLQSQDAALLAQAEGSNAAAQSLVAGLSTYGYLATGASFTIDEPLNLSRGLYVQTTASGAAITVADAITLSKKGKLDLVASGNLVMDAAINTDGSAAFASGGTTTLGSTILATNDITINAGENLDIDRKIVSSTGTVTLNSSGTIAETGSGIIDAEGLAGSSSGGTTLNAANVIYELDSFTNSGAGGFIFNTSFKDQDELIIEGAVSAGTVSLTANGDLTESSLGLISATTLTGTATGGVALTGANRIANLDFNPDDESFSLTDDVNLTITGTLNSNGVVLNDTGTIAETTGVIDASRLGGSSAGGANFSGANLISTLGNFTNAGAGGIALTDGEALVVDGVLNAGTGNLTLTTKGTSSTIGLNKNVTAGGTLVLNSSSTIAETAADIITAASLSGSADGAVSLKGANLIGGLGNFTASGNLSLTDEEALTIGGTVNTGTKSQTIQVTSGNLDLTGTLDGGTITLGSSTSEVYGAGKITASLLNVTANTGIDLTGDNDIKTIGTDTTNSGPNVINNPG